MTHTDTDIWAQCQGEQQIRSIEGRLWRLVESQEQVATLNYVDSLDEQAVLEDLLESAKPPAPYQYHPVTNEPLHYLLKTPFRYPPLKWGSRFGQQHEPSLFYGGCSVEATLTESAYYRLVFLHAMPLPGPSDRLTTEHTLFSVSYRTTAGVCLQQVPFDQFQAVLTHPCDYRASQHTGSSMRAAGVEAFEYLSARSATPLTCVALFTPRPFADSSPESMERWLCEVSRDKVTFKAVGNHNTVHFPLTSFLVDGTLPKPA